MTGKCQQTDFHLMTVRFSLPDTFSTFKRASLINEIVGFVNTLRFKGTVNYVFEEPDETYYDPEMN